MKPVKLEFCGLNSFSERASIDFEPLLQSGIFGIFGETGSGKSTILDAINFALYGDIERNPDKIDKINYKCDELDVKFTFDIFSDGARRTYLVERNIKRKSGTHKAFLYELKEGGTSAAIADNVKSVGDKITEIIGINKDDFRKCIALPQGEFAQFVNSAPAERIELIERLFNLQKYGKTLKAKLSARESAAETAFATVSGGLSVYESDTKEKLAEEETQKAALSAGVERQKALAANAAEEYASLSSLYDKKVKYLAAAEKLQELEKRKPEFDELGKVLPSLSHCENAVKNANEKSAAEGELIALAAEAKKLLQEGKSFEAALAVAEKALEDSRADEQIESLQRAESAMESVLPTVKSYRAKIRELDACREEYRAAVSACTEKGSELERLTAEGKSAEEKLAAMPEPDIDDYFRKQLKGGILKDEYARTLCYLKDLQAEIRTFGDRSPLYDFIDKELSRKADEYRDLILTLKDAKLNVGDTIEQFREQMSARRKAETQITKIAGDIKTCSARLEALTAKVEEVKARGAALAAERDETASRLKEVFGDTQDYDRKLSEARAATEAAKAKKKKLSSDCEIARERLSQNRAAVAANAAKTAAAKSRFERVDGELIQNLAKAGAGGIEECRALVEKYRGYEQAYTAYTNFTADYAAAKSAAESYRAEEGIYLVTREQVEAAKLKKAETEAAFNELSGKLAVAGKSVDDLKKRLKEKAALEEKVASVRRERDLIAKLKSLIRDNKFMEYIAGEHLVNISRAASRTLIDLTDGRYYLSYTDNNFCVGDNYNGGELRKVKTLSGGETFLVSLSLALALSAAICNRSLKSIEFFFLDEGFGTLDGDLIDTVLGALEKLKNDNFSIGLISHVEELKHRINSKILVSKATESHGSTIKISC